VADTLNALSGKACGMETLIRKEKLVMKGKIAILCRWLYREVRSN